MYRTLLGLMGALAAAVLLAGLSLSASVGAPANVRFVNGAEPKTLDPHLLTGQPGGRIATATFEGLTRYDPETLGPAPGVAESWEISDDGRRYAFRLRKNARWSDGKPIDASDVIYSFRRMLDPKLGAEYAYMLHPIRGARAYNTYESLARTLDERIAPALERLVEERGSAGSSAIDWRKLESELPLHDTLRDSQAPEIRALLDREPGAIAGVELARFQRALGAEAERLRRVARDVSTRFGKSLGIWAEGPHELVIELEAPTPYFLDITSFYSALLVPRHAIERHGSAWFLPETLVGNGPFVIRDWRVNDRIRLEKNPHYWGKDEVRADAIEALATENVTTALNLFLTGEVDWLPSAYPVDLVQQLRERDDFYSHAAFSVYYYRFNTQKKPLNDARVREAITLAVDREMIVQQVTGLGQLPATHFVPPGVPGYESPPSRIGLDVERARRLLDEAGFPGGRGFPEVGILYNTSEGHKKVAEVVADQLKRHLGIQVTPYNQEWQSYLAATRSGSFQMARAAWIGDYLDPNTFLDMWVTNGGNNQTGFSSPNYDAIIHAAANMEAFSEEREALLSRVQGSADVASLLERRERSGNTEQRRRLLDAARMKLLSLAEAILIQREFPIMPVYFYVNSGLKVKELRGHYTQLRLPSGKQGPNLRGIHPLRALWLERDAP